MPDDFDFEIDRVVSTIAQRKCTSVLLQFPEGLKRKAADVAASVASEIASKVPDCNILVSGEPCYGACDLPDSNAELVVNFGHLPIPSMPSSQTVLYVQARSSADPVPAVERALPDIPDKVGVLTTAQHIHTLPAVVEFLRGKGKEVFVGKGDDRLFAEGQVLGCNTSSAGAIIDKVDGFLFVGTGNFHPLAVALATSKKVIVADPLTGEVRDMKEHRDKVLRQRHAVIQVAKDAKRFGILLSTKTGQRRRKLAFDVKEKLDNAGLDAVLVEMGNITPQKLDAFGLDCWVSTACPRLAIDDGGMFSKPIITPVELDIVLGLGKWEEYAFDEIV